MAAHLNFESVQIHGFEYRVMCVHFWGFQLLHEQGSFAVTEDEIFVFVVSLNKVSYHSLILNVQEK